MFLSSEESCNPDDNAAVTDKKKERKKERP